MAAATDMSLLSKIKNKIFKPDIDHYLASGKIPWSPGYKQFRNTQLNSAITDNELLQRFSVGELLPQGYGVGLDERIIEYPWLFSRLPDGFGHLLDGGSALNYPYLIDSTFLAKKQMVIMTLAPESQLLKRSNLSYVFGDLRNTFFKENTFDYIVSISTLEHIGMDNTKIYTSDTVYNEANSEDFILAVREFRRILKPSGHLIITVPFGKAQDLGWLKQFDVPMLKSLIDAFGSSLVSKTFYKYDATGWQVSNEMSCGDCEYFDVHSSESAAVDLAAAARAVACLEFVKND
jgi:SAM-dependent methyltransferase